VNVVGIGCPGKINYVFSLEVPGKITVWTGNFGALFFITISDLLGVLKFSCSGNDVRWIKSNLHVVVTPDTVKLACNILIRMPSLMIVLCYLQEPLRH